MKTTVYCALALSLAAGCKGSPAQGIASASPSTRGAASSVPSAVTAKAKAVPNLGLTVAEFRTRWNTVRTEWGEAVDGSAIDLGEPTISDEGLVWTKPAFRLMVKNDAPSGKMTFVGLAMTSEESGGDAVAFRVAFHCTVRSITPALKYEDAQAIQNEFRMPAPGTATVTRGTVKYIYLHKEGGTLTTFFLPSTGAPPDTSP